MDFLPKAISDYINTHSQEEPELLKALNRETHLKVLMPAMLSGAYQGRVLSMISKLLAPQSILEIGTYTGYSALCLAEGLADDGLIHTIDKNEELTDLQNRYFEKSGYRRQIKQYAGDALQIIPDLDISFDLVFIDADKEDYTTYFNLVIDKLSSGGVILSDNVLWYGKVTEKVDENDLATKALVAYNDMLKKDSRVESIMLPIRDGLTISRKK